MAASAAAALGNRATNSMLEQLPVEIMVELLHFMDLPSRLKLARCNSALSRQILRESLGAWEIIDCFELLGPSSRKVMTDNDLSSLLTRVNAREVTKGLVLDGCRSILGSGLSPLRLSTVLEYVTLRDTLASENPAPFLWNLHPSLSRCLEYVVLPNECMKNPSQQVLDFHRSLRQAKMDRMKLESTRCECCNEQIVDEKMQLIPGRLGVPDMQCYSCEGKLCRRSTCKDELLECNACGLTRCSDCELTFRCSFGCGHAYCVTDVCDELASCTYCGKRSCEDCDGLVTCMYCKMDDARKTCEECGLHPNVCTKDCHLCKWCYELGECFHCKDKFCVKCKDDETIQCFKCEYVFCNKAACKARIEKCGVCDEWFCKDCVDFEYCVLCETSFCKNHGRLVDCSKCGDLRHCRKCGYVDGKICQVCARGCFDDCCCEDDERKAKRQKTEHEE